MWGSAGNNFYTLLNHACPGGQDSGRSGVCGVVQVITSTLCSFMRVQAGKEVVGV